MGSIPAPGANFYRTKMNSVKLNRNELLGIVRQNKEKHVKEFVDAVNDFKLAVLKISQDNLKLAEEQDITSIGKIKSIPAFPTSYAKSYDKAIRMLELSVDTEIELESHDFDQLVLDEWQWKQSFSTMNSTYKSFT